MNLKVSLFVTLVIVTQFAHSHSLPTTKTLPGRAGKESNFSQLYVFGGRSNDFDEFNVQQFSKTASRLNTISGKWEAIRSLPIAEESSCGAVIGEKIYLFGGSADINRNLTSLDSANVYDPLTDTYTQLESMPKKLYGCGAAALNGSIYIAGGHEDQTSFRSLLRYDIQTNQWAALSQMNVERSGHQLVELNGLLYAIGGETNITEIYNPATDQWNFAETAPHEEYWSISATAHEGKIYVSTRDGFEVFSPNINRWTVLSSPEGYNHRRALVSMNGKLWAVGGQYLNRKDHEWVISKAVHTYDSSTGQWTREQDLDVARGFHNAFVVNH